MGMFPDVRELDEAAMWRAGALPRKLAWVIIAACAISIALAAVGARMLWLQDGRATHVDRFWFCNGLSLLLGFWIAATFVPRWRLARLLRVATLLPVAHGLAMAVGWRMWTVASPHMHEVTRLSPLVRALPIGWLIAGLGAACGCAGWLVARRRAREWAHTTCSIALAQLLLLGLWLPVAATLFEHRLVWTDRSVLLIGGHETVAAVLVPPLIGAIAFGALATRWPDLLAKHRGTLQILLSVLLACAITARLGEPRDRNVIYANFIHALLASAAVAIGALVALAAANAHRASRRRGRIEGVVAPGPEPIVAAYQITSWLRGPRGVVRSFVATTPHGDVLVPGGIALAAPVPADTTELSTGEATAVFRTGDRIVLEGFVSPTGGPPFRDSSLPIPGPQGVAVAAPDARRPDLAEIALVAWRPCVAYLVILLAIGLPALAGALGA